MEKETRHQRRHYSLHCPKLHETGLFHPLKVSLSFSVLKLLNMKLELSKEKLK